MPPTTTYGRAHRSSVLDFSCCSIVVIVGGHSGRPLVSVNSADAFRLDGQVGESFVFDVWSREEYIIVLNDSS
jgi:hypothetical protein